MGWENNGETNCPKHAVALKIPIAFAMCPLGTLLSNKDELFTIIGLHQCPQEVIPIQPHKYYAI